MTSDAYWAQYPSSGCPGPGQPRVPLYYLVEKATNLLKKSPKINVNMTRCRLADPVCEGGCARAYALQTLAAVYDRIPANQLLTRPSKRCLCIYLSIHWSIRPFQAVNQRKGAKKRTKTLGKHPCCVVHLGR